MGYKYYDKVGKDVLFPFGFGLSYTEFEYFDLKVNIENEKVDIRFKIKMLEMLLEKRLLKYMLRKLIL